MAKRPQSAMFRHLMRDSAMRKKCRKTIPCMTDAIDRPPWSLFVLPLPLLPRELLLDKPKFWTSPSLFSRHQDITAAACVVSGADIVKEFPRNERPAARGCGAPVAAHFILRPCEVRLLRLPVGHQKTSPDFFKFGNQVPQFVSNLWL